ncbi:MAG: thioredoxin family protein [Ignavibacteria bacterium]|nr:thioredoxin family protein [Ignavibacteria bacterium]
MNNIITKEIIDGGYTYPQYRKLINDLLKEGKTTSNNHSESLIEYTKVNVQRMNRLDKTTDINEDLKREIADLEKKMIWVILAEAWCGDVAQNLPVIAKIADLSQNIDLKLILRDENLEVMDEYLTNGGRSIPKLICLDSGTLEELGTWGPRPEEVQERFLKDKADPNVSPEERSKNNQLWYIQDKTQSIQKEFLRLIKIWKK